MQIDGESYRTIWPGQNGELVHIIDQTRLPHRFEVVTLNSVHDAAVAIKDMQVRGAPLIGATAAYGVFLGMIDNPSDDNLSACVQILETTRPTAINLKWALDRMFGVLKDLDPDFRPRVALDEANKICEEDVETCRQIGVHGLALIEKAYQSKPDRPVNVLTHCNAGWLATIDWGTATSPVYQAQQADIPVHVWVDETRPRNQGASLTCYELGQQGIAHTLIVDNAGGHLMQQGQVDLVITGTDRTARNGDVANKIGTYLKALAAKDNNIPFYVALPSSTIDWECNSGNRIPIEYRAEEEVTHLDGVSDDEEVSRFRITPDQTRASNPAFDVTPASMVTGLITERGIADASEEGLVSLFPELN